MNEQLEKVLVKSDGDKYEWLEEGIIGFLHVEKLHV